jgi:hypothetical protein
MPRLEAFNVPSITVEIYLLKTIIGFLRALQELPTFYPTARVPYITTCAKNEFYAFRFLRPQNPDHKARNSEMV